LSEEADDRLQMLLARVLIFHSRILYQ